jgi:hypothetical protein
MYEQKDKKYTENNRKTKQVVIKFKNLTTQTKTRERGDTERRGSSKNTRFTCRYCM